MDSEPLWTLAEIELAERLGGAWSWELKTQIVGTRLDLAVPAILRWYDVAPTDGVVAETTGWLLDRMVGLFRLDLALRPGARALLDALRDDRVPLALVSSSYRVLVDAALESLGESYFEVTVAGDEVAHGKPDPEPYLTAAARLGVDPRACLVLEDSPSGVASGEAAGCAVVAVPDVTPIPEAAGRLVVASLAALEVRSLTTLVSGDRPTMSVGTRRQP